MRNVLTQLKNLIDSNSKSLCDNVLTSESICNNVRYGGYFVALAAAVGAGYGAYKAGKWGYKAGQDYVENRKKTVPNKNKKSA